MTAFQISAIHILRAAKLLWRQKSSKSTTELKLTNKELPKIRQQQQNMKQTNLEENNSTTTFKGTKTKFDALILHNFF